MIGKIYNVVIMSKLLVTMIVLLLIGGCSTNWNFENTGLPRRWRRAWAGGRTPWRRRRL